MKPFFDSTLPRGGDHVLSGPVAIVLGIGIVVSVAIAQTIQTIEIRRESADFQLVAEQTINDMEERIDNQSELIRSIVSFFNSSKQVDRVGFQSFVADSLRRQPTIQQVGWVPRVSAAERAERAEFEASAQREGLTGFQINERSIDRRPIPAAPRPEYFPNFFLEPSPANAATYGLDQESELIRRVAMERARDSGELVFSSRLELALVTDNRLAIIAYAPIYKSGAKPNTIDQRREDLIGYAYGVVRPVVLVDMLRKERARTMDNAVRSGMRIDVYDTTDQSTPNFLFTYRGLGDISDENPKDQIVVGKNDFVSTSSFGGREWTFVARPASGVLGGGISWQTGLAFGASLVLSLLLAAYLHTIINRARSIEAEVSLRTNELRLTNELLRDSEDRIRVITNSLPALIAYVDRNLIYRFANQRYREIGVDPETLIGKSVADVRRGQSFETVRPYFERAANGERLSFEITADDGNGGLRYSALDCTPDIVDGVRRGFYLLGRDITAEREAELEVQRTNGLLRESEDRIRIITNSVPALIAYVDTDLVFRFANERYRDIGIDPETLVGQRFSNRLNDGSYEIILPFYERAARGESVSFEIHTLAPDGTRRYRTMTCTPDIIQGEVRGFYVLGSDVTAQRNAEDELKRTYEQLRESQERIRAIADSVPALIAYIDKDLIYRFANKRYRDIAIDPDKLIGQPLAKRRNDGSFDVIKPYFERAARGEEVTFEISPTESNGERRFRSISCTPDIVNGEVRGFYLLGRDVTDQRNAEIEIERANDLLRNSEERLRIITNSLPALIAHVDQDMCIQYMNERFSLLTLESDDVVGKQLKDVLGPERFNELHRACERALQGEASQSEVTFSTKHGRDISILTDFTPDVDAEGAVRGFYFVALNVTAQRALEIELDRFFRQSLSFMWVATFDGFLRRFNDTWSSVLGYTHDELVSTPYIDFIHPDDRAKAEGALARLQAEGDLTNLEIRMLCKDGSERFILWNAAANRQERQIYATGHDITELKAVDRMKDEFVSTVSHELRTPLTSIKGALGLMRAKTLGTLPTDMNTMLDIAYKNCDRLVLLINDILDIEKIEAGKMTFNFEAIDIVTAVRNAVAANQGYADQFGVHLVVENKLGRGAIRADEGRMMQVLANLISNACKFSPEGDDVRICLERHGRMIRVSVEDHGPGIPEDFRSRIFEKFSQGDSSDRRKVSGTGLGLSIVRAIVERHGGRIDFTSKVGEGSTFFFDIPEMGASQSTNTAVDSQRILICEDDPDVAEILRDIIEHTGHGADVASSAAQAKAFLERNAYAGMTLDIMLPDISGVEFFKELRADPRTRLLPIIIISAKASESAEQLSGSAINVVDWLDKPFDEERLENALKSAVIMNAQSTQRVLHIEDDPDLVQIVSRRAAHGVSFVSAGSLAAARKLLGKERFDLVILDLILPDGHGEDLLPLMINPDGSPIPVIIFSAMEVPAKIAERVETVLIKTQSTDQMLMEAIDAFVTRHNLVSSHSDNTSAGARITSHG